MQTTQPSQQSQNLETLKTNIPIILSETPLGPDNLYTVVIKLMQISEKLPNLTGLQRRELVITALTEYVGTNSEQQGLLALLPSLIDKSIAIEKGLIIIQAMDAVATCCFGLMSKTKK